MMRFSKKLNTILLIAFSIVSALLFTRWQAEVASKKLPTALPDQAVTNVYLPESDPLVPRNLVSSHLITVETDKLSITIDRLGGDVVEVRLREYPQSLKDKRPLELLRAGPSFFHLAQSGLIGPDGVDNSPAGRPLYTTPAPAYQLKADEAALEVPLTYRAANGLTIVKRFLVKRGSYAITMEHQVHNNASELRSLQLFGQLKQTIEQSEVEQKRLGFSSAGYRGTAYSSHETRYKKYSFKQLKKHDLSVRATGGWAGMLQQYFATAWIPPEQEQHQFYTKHLSSIGGAMIGFKGDLRSIAPGQTESFNAKLWVGPQLQDEMAREASNLNLTVDYGWLWFLSQPLFKLLKWLHNLLNNWGFAIIAITFIVRGILFPLTKAQFASMAKMRLLQPKVETLRQRCGEDKQRMGREMMALYQAEKVNPLGGCLPVLLQMPIFLALYWMLMGSVELRHAAFGLWIQDLSAKDPYYVLPILMGITMFFIQKASPAAPGMDPMQQKVMQFMPVLFTLFFLYFPSGLVLYYVVSNLFTLVQQKILYRRAEEQQLQQQKKKRH